MKDLVAFFEIPATDFSRAVKFYEAIFNRKLSVIERPAEKMAFFSDESGKCVGSISFASEFKPSKDGVLISLSVENIEETMGKIEQNGGKISVPKTKIEADAAGYFSVFIDVEGNRVGLYSDK